MSWWKNFLRGAFTPPESAETIMAKINQAKEAENIMPLHEALKTSHAELTNVPNRWVPIEEKPKDPELDPSTKPEDVVGYCFGFVCPKKHIGHTFDTITVDGHKERMVCQTCGAVTKPATVKRTAEAQWRMLAFLYPREWGWSQDDYNLNTMWTKYEFVQFLDSPKTRKTARKK